MVEVNLIFEVHGYRPNWAKKNIDIKYSESRYRIYVNDDLITERSWSWDNDVLLNENMWVYCELNSNYTLRLDPVLYNRAQAKFNIKNLKVCNLSNEVNQITDLQIEYKLINTL